MNTNDKNGSETTDNSEAGESIKNGNEPQKNDSSLQALIGEERSLARERLREKTNREPTESEIDRWLSEQTEGY